MSAAVTSTEAAPPVVAPAEPSNRLVIVAWSGELDRIWPTLILASTGAASGMDTTVFFTFWGLFPLVREDRRITGKNAMQRMLSVMTHGDMRHLRTSRLNFAGAGPAMMRSLARRHRVADPKELFAACQELGVHLVPCQMSMDLMGVRREDLIDGLDEPAGAATMLAAARGAATFFI